MKRVVVTGLGAITCNGNCVEEFWQASINGKIGYRKLPFSPQYLDKTCGVIQGLDFSRFLSSKELESWDRATSLGLIASLMAMSDANLIDSKYTPSKCSVIIGTTLGTNSSLEVDDFTNKWYKDKQIINSKRFKQYRHVDIANAISLKFNFEGKSMLVGTACAAGNNAIGDAFDLIKMDEADVVICGGVEALGQIAILGFNSLQALAKDECKPFDKRRDGIVISEGAGILILESEEHARKRNARIYAEVGGWASNCDAGNITAPIEDGSRIAELIIKSLEVSNIDKHEVNYISLHGTGTKKNDIAESNGIVRIFGNDIKPYASSIKSMIGHTFGAAGALNSIVSVLAICNSIIPPNVNLEEMDEDIKLNLITKENFHTSVNCALSHSLGFGGCNVAVLFKKYKNEK